MRIGLLSLLLFALSCGTQPPAPPTQAEVCSGVECGEGHCVMTVELAAACSCEEGYLAQGLQCVSASPCLPNPCAGGPRPACVALEDGAALCRCDEGLSDIGGQCLVATLCSPNPCIAPHRSQCTAGGGAASCGCDPNFTLMNGVCSLGSSSCPAAHWGDGQDPFEPDDCLSLAAVVTPTPGNGVLQHRSISPATDIDWVRLKTGVEHVYEVKLSPSGVLGPTLSFHDQSGAPLPESAVDLAVGGKRLMSVDGADWLLELTEPANGSGVTPFTLSIEDLGADDHGRTPATATPLTSGVTTAANFPSTKDVDVFSFSVTAGHLYDFNVDAIPQSLAQVHDGAGQLLSTSTNSSSQFALTASKTETLYLTVSAPATPTSYSVTFRDQGIDDHGDTEATATPFPAGAASSVSGVNAGSFDRDLFSFVAVSGDTYVFRCNTPTGRCGVGVRSSAGQALAGAPASEPFLAWTAPTSATYFVYPATTGAYTLTLTHVTDDHGGTVSTATAIADGGTVTGVYAGSTDVDMFAVAAPPGDFFRFECQSADFTTIYLESYASSGTSITTVTSAPHRIIEQVPADGQLFFALKTAFPAYGAYSCEITRLGPDDFPNDVASAPSMPLGSSFAGRLESQSDVDFFQLPTVARTVYRASCQPADAQSTNMQCHTTTSTGTLVRALNYPAWHNVLASGPLFMRAAPYGPLQFGNYAVLAYPIAVDDEPDTRGTATLLSVPTAPTAAEADTEQDVDVLRLDAVGGRVYRFEASGSNLSVRRTDAVGTSLGTGLVQFVKAPADGPQFLEITTSSNDLTPYQYQLADYGTDDYGETPAQAAPLDAGVLEYDTDVDTFAVSVTAGRVYRLSSGAIAPKGARVRLVSGSGQGYVSSSTSSTVAWDATVDGGVFLQVSTPMGGVPVPYTPTIVDIGTDDCGDTPATSNALLPGSIVDGVTEGVGDLDYFNSALTVSRVLRARCSSDAGTCQVQFTNASGNSLSSSFISGSLYYEAPGAMTVYTRVSHNTQRGEAPYQLTLDDLGTDDFGDSIGTATPLALGSPTSGRIEWPSDQDVLSFQLNAGQHSLTVSGLDLSVIVQVQSGGQLLSQSAPASGATYTFNVTTAGTFYLVARPLNATGAYSLEVQ